MTATSVTPTDTVRTVVGGRVDGDTYIIVLDGGQEVETTDEAVATAAANSKRELKGLEVGLEPQGSGRRPKLIDLRVVDRPAAPKNTAPQSTTAITKASGLAPGTMVRSPSEFLAAQAAWQRQHFHVLNPIGDFSALPEHYAITWSVVHINMDDAAKEVYRDPLWCKDDEVALAKNGLSRLARVADLSITTTRTDGRMIPNLWEVQATATWKSLDGSERRQTATEELDLRDGSDRSLKVMGRGQSRGALIAARAKGLRNCEARAINAVIRLVSVIPQVYKKRDLEKPFVVVKPVFLPDMSDPTMRAIVTERALGGMSALYPQANAASPEPAPEHLDTIGDTPGRQHVIDVPSQAEQSTTARRAPHNPFDEPAPVAATQAPTSLPANQRHIAHVKAEKSGTSEKGRAWTLYEIAATTGETWRTFNTEFVQEAEFAKGKGWAVRIAEKESEKYPDQMELTALEHVDPRQQALPMDEERY